MDHIPGEQVFLIKVKKTDVHIQLLFEMLKKREMSISHTSLPSYSAHKNFVLNHPYRVWYLIKQDNEFVGSAYILKNNCIGINLIKNIKKITPVVIDNILNKYKPLKAIKSVRSEGFDFNVTPYNKEYINVLKKMGAKLSQVTFVFDKK